MTFVGDLIRDATGSTVPVQELLRRLKVIAARSKTTELAAWVEHESSGYPASEAVPAYRGPFEVPVRGQFANPARVASNMPIPAVAFPEEYREGHLFNVLFRESVAELDHIVETSGDGVIRAVWPDDAIAFTEVLRQQGKIGMDAFTHVISAHRAIPRSMVVAVLDNVRTRILDLALSFEDVAPNAGESRATPEESARMSQVFHTNVYGGQVAVGSTSVEQIQVNCGDEDALLGALAAVGVDPSSLEELKKALAEDRADNGGSNPTEPGSRVSSWLGRFSLRSLAAGRAVAVGAAGNVVSQLILAYFGMA